MFKILNNFTLKPRFQNGKATHLAKWHKDAHSITLGNVRKHLNIRTEG